MVFYVGKDHCAAVADNGGGRLWKAFSGAVSVCHCSPCSRPRFNHVRRGSAAGGCKRWPASGSGIAGAGRALQAAVIRVESVRSYRPSGCGPLTGTLFMPLCIRRSDRCRRSCQAGFVQGRQFTDRLLAPLFSCSDDGDDHRRQGDRGGAARARGGTCGGDLSVRANRAPGWRWVGNWRHGLREKQETADAASGTIVSSSDVFFNVESESLDLVARLNADHAVDGILAHPSSPSGIEIVAGAERSGSGEGRRWDLDLLNAVSR